MGRVSVPEGQKESVCVAELKFHSKRTSIGPWTRYRSLLIQAHIRPFAAFLKLVCNVQDEKYSILTRKCNLKCL